MISWQIVVNHLRFNNCMVLERLNFRLNYQVFLHHKIFRLFSIIQWHHKIDITLTKYSDLLSGLYTSILEWWSKAVCKNCYIDIYFLMCIFDLSCWNFRHLYWSACANQCHSSQPCHGGDRKTFEVMTSTKPRRNFGSFNLKFNLSNTIQLLKRRWFTTICQDIMGSLIPCSETTDANINPSL
jgi:hypothetical protein